ncbi:hypothetical protein Bbelb_079180 [Branchiostoma belcheri]|nr:hypothetical protein Bbelb_079180 [Branchiostoma belcheri]
MAEPATSAVTKGAQLAQNFEDNLATIEKSTMVKYVQSKKDKFFGGKDVQPSPERQTYWSLTDVDYDGVPFQLVGRIVYACHQGKDKALKQKEKYKAQKEAKAVVKDKENTLVSPVHSLTYNSHLTWYIDKGNAPVILYTVSLENTKALQRQASLALKAELKSSSSTVEGIVEYHARFPSITEHENHPILGEAAELREPVDPEIEKLILKLASDGARKVSEFRRHINTFVKDELLRGQPLPPLTRRRYHPTDKDIRNILSKGKKHARNSEDDQVNLQTLTTRWATESCCHIKFRASQLQEDGSSTKLLFCYQTHWQQRLLHMYGGQMCLLDATYRTCRYSIPLFFLCVRTNVCYAVVGCFIVQKEETEDIQEALNIFKVWNPDWMPSHFMVDKSNMEINALKAEFPEANVILCDFHREKAWVEWSRKAEHGVRDQQDALLKLLRAIASASTREEYYTRLNELQESDIWKSNVKVQTWISIHWLPEAEKWVQAFRAEHMTVAIYTNNGIERQNETLKYKHLDGYKNCSLTELVTRLVTSFLPETHRKYIELNVRYSPGYSMYSSTLPNFLKNRPRDMVEHILSRYEDARLHIDPCSIVNKGDGVFQVKSSSQSTYHTISFGTNNTMPSCTCTDWMRYKLPCKHLCAVFQHVPEWGWESFPSKYKDNPIFTLDTKYLGHIPSSDGPDEDDNDAIISTITVDDSACKEEVKKVTLRTQCASVIRELTELTYLVHDEEYLELLKTELEDILEDVRAHTPHDGPFALNTTPKKRGVSAHTPHDGPLAVNTTLVKREGVSAHTPHDGPLAVNTTLVKREGVSAHTPHDGPLAVNTTLVKREGVSAHTPHDGPLAVNTTLVKREGVSAHTPHDGPLALNTTLVKREGVSAHTPHDGPLAVNTTLVKREGVSAHTPHDGPLAVNTTLVKREGVSAHTPHDGPLALNTTLVKREGVSAHTPHDGPLALNTTLAPNKNRKNPHTNRVGHWAEVMRRNYRVNNVATEDNLPELTCTVEELIVDDTEETLPEVPQDDEWVTINHTRLTVDDRQLLLTGQWLTDKHINCAQHLLKEEFPLLDGLRDTVVLASGKDLSTCVPVPATAESIQLHHIGDHWVVSCTKEGQTGVTVYDSMYTTVGISLRSQLVRLYKNHASVDEGILPVTVICAQRQVGSGDCGLFAVANAVALAEGQCPTDIVFEQTKMRKHLDKSLAAKSLPMFPVITTFQRSKYFEKSTYQLCVFCTCLQYRQDAPMIQCDQCANWFHYRCVNISARDVAVLVAEQKYSCPACKGK